MARQARIIYKLPTPFQTAHRELLEGWDWGRPMVLAEVLPEIPELAPATLELISRDRQMIVRTTTGRGAIAVRNYSDGLESG